MLLLLCMMYICHRSSFTPVEFFESRNPSEQKSIVKVAAGAGSIGAHSIALDAEGFLYSWGVSYAVGLGQVKAVTIPTQVFLIFAPLLLKSRCI